MKYGVGTLNTLLKIKKSCCITTRNCQKAVQSLPYFCMPNLCSGCRIRLRQQRLFSGLVESTKNQMEVFDPQTSTSILVEKLMKGAIILAFLEIFWYHIIGQEVPVYYVRSNLSFSLERVKVLPNPPNAIQKLKGWRQYKGQVTKFPAQLCCQVDCSFRYVILTSRGCASKTSPPYPRL